MTASVPGGVTLTLMQPVHAREVLAIYQAGIDEGNATFEIAAPAWEQFEAAKLPDHRHIALDANGKVFGWTAATAVSDRCVYAGVVEHSVYIHPDARGRGIGAALLQALIDSTEAAGIWTIQSGIFPENAASLALHGAMASAPSAAANASADATASGAMSFSSNAAVRASPSGECPPRRHSQRSVRSRRVTHPDRRAPGRRVGSEGAAWACPAAA